LSFFFRALSIIITRAAHERNDSVRSPIGVENA
jgi:hypothetical protein